MSWSDIEVMPGISGADYWSFAAAAWRHADFLLNVYNSITIVF